MKKFLEFIIFFLILPVCLAAQPKDTLRLLAIGNSFSVDAIEQNLHEIALADGHMLIIGNLYIGGCSLERHWENAKDDKPDYSYRKIGTDGVKTTRENTSLMYAFADEKWDIVTFQQASHYSGLPDTYEPYLGKLVKFVRKNVPSADRYLMHQTWSYAADATHPDFYRYDSSQMKMYEALCSAYSAAAAKYKMEVIPSGTAIQNSRGTFNRDNANRDGYHLSYSFGRYLAACAWYETIYHASVIGNTFLPDRLLPERAALAQECAHAASLKPWKVTKLPELEVAPANYDFKAIPEYELPDPLRFDDGSPVATSDDWFSKRRPQILEQFETQMFGRAPGAIPATYQTLKSEPAYGGKAVRTEVRIIFTKQQYIQLAIYTPADAAGPVPAFLGINFNGNRSIDPDALEAEASHITSYGVYPQVEPGKYASRWPVEDIVERGYALVTFHASDVDPDFDDGYANGVHRLAYPEGRNYPEPDEWATLAAWSWGLSRTLDFLETFDGIDASRVAVIGHSRMGKAAVWAGALDQRFAMVISNESGCGGAALSRRAVGETIGAINRHFPHWFCDNFKKYNENESALPFDQHELLALVAPRPLYVASAEGDRWSDPVGERLSLQEAGKVYKFLGCSPDVLGYHIRQGVHEMTPADWEYYLDFADRDL